MAEGAGSIGARTTAERSDERLRTLTSWFRWTLFIANPSLIALAGAWNLLSGTTRTVTLWAVAAAFAVLLVRVARIETRVSTEGVQVRNPFRTLEVGWDEVARADWIARGVLGHGLATWGLDAHVRLTLRDGRYVSLTSTYVFLPETAHRITGALRRTATPAGVAVRPLHRDGPPPPHA